MWQHRGGTLDNWHAFISVVIVKGFTTLNCDGVKCQAQFGPGLAPQALVCMPLPMISKLSINSLAILIRVVPL
jgi:hypothetical protein